MVQRSNLLLQLLYICTASTLSTVISKTSTADKVALLAFKALISSDQGLLASWTSNSDPCTRPWLGVSCNCSDLQPPLSAACATAGTADPSHSVISLDLSIHSISRGRIMIGALAPELGSLVWLHSLRLDGHDLQVPSNGHNLLHEC